jgi:hypothetical protein
MGRGNFTIFTAFKARDGVSPVFKNMAQGANSFQGRLGGLQNSMNCVTGIMKKSIGVFAAVFAVDKIKGWVELTTEAASVELTAQEKLTQVLKNNSALRARGASEYITASQNLINYASKSQQKGVIGDEVIVGAMQQLGSMGFDDKIIKKIIPTIADLAVQQKGYNATIEDTQTLAKGLGKAIGGNIGYLGRMGIILSKDEKKRVQGMSTLKRTEYLYNLLSKRVGGLNEKLAETDEGAKVQALNNWSDRLEDIGKRIIPIEGRIFRLFNRSIPALSKGVQVFFNNFDSAIRILQPVFNKLGESFKYLSGHLIPELVGLSPVLKMFFEGILVPALVFSIDSWNKLFIVIDKTYNFIKSNFVPVISVLAGVLSGLALFKTVQFFQALRVQMALASMQGGILGTLAKGQIVTALKSLGVAIWGSVKAIWAQNAALLSNPLFWIPAAIGLVVAGIVLLWKNWDFLTTVIGNWSAKATSWLSIFWIKVQEVFGAVGGFIKAHFTDALLAALGPIGWVILGLKNIGGALGNIKGGQLPNFNHKNNAQSKTPISPRLVNNQLTQRTSNPSGVIEVRNIVENKNNSRINSGVNLLSSNNLKLNPAF